MKKLLCLICALLVLSVPLLAAAQGEAQRTRLTFSADREQLAEYLRLLNRFSEKEQRSFGKGLAELLNGLEITSDADGAASATAQSVANASAKAAAPRSSRRVCCFIPHHLSDKPMRGGAEVCPLAIPARL